MKKIFLFLFFVVILATSSFAQGELNIYADSVVTAMMRKHTTAIGRGAKEVPGFRVQVIQSPDKATVMKRKAAFLAAYPNLRVEYSYSEPYHKLKAGAFPNREECQKWILENNVKSFCPEAMPVYDEHVRTKDLLEYLGIGEDGEPVEK
jgi:hypothetical protein